MQGGSSNEQYIIPGYDPLTYGAEYIKDEDVVRPSNHKFSRNVDFTNKGSMADHETYGTCDECFDGGPVWSQCRFCGKGNVYTIFSFGLSRLDSITLSESLERDFCPQRANRTCVWQRAPLRFVNIKFLQTAVGKNRLLKEVDRTRIFNQLMDMLPFDKRQLVANTNM